MDEVITGRDLVRGAEINDAIAMEHGMSSEGAYHVGRELDVDVQDAVKFAAEYACRRVKGHISTRDAREAVTDAMVMGALSSLRAAKLAGRYC